MLSLLGPTLSSRPIRSHDLGGFLGSWSLAGSHPKGITLVFVCARAEGQATSLEEVPIAYL